MSQQTSFNFDQPTIATGEILRNTGIDKAVSNADALSPDWSDKAYKILLEYISRTDQPFMTEDVRTYAMQQKGFVAPMSDRAWGGPMAKARHAGKIVKVGIRAVTNPKAHCANATVWQVKINT